jgi:hypothetical protein
MSLSRGAVRCRAAAVLGAIVLGACCGELCAADLVCAAPLKRIVSRAVAFATDGGHYAAWQVRRGGTVTVLDTRSGVRKEVAPSPTCELYDRESVEPMSKPAAGGRFLLVCNEGTELLDARSGALTMLPRTGPYDPGWERIGLRYVEGEVKSGCQQSSVERRRGAYCIALYELASGTVSYRPESQLPDIDRTGAPVICTRLRQNLIAARAGTSENLFSYGNGVLAQRARRVTDIRIDRCTGRATVLRGSGEAEDIRVAGGILSWDTGQEGQYFDNEQLQMRHGTLTTYRLFSGRRHIWRLQRLPLLGTGLTHAPGGVFGYSAHNADRVFWFAALRITSGRSRAVEASAVYAAPLTPG